MRRLLALAALLPSLSAQTWIVNPANGHEYALIAPMTWTAAESFANLVGGHLATVRSAAENAWLVSTFVTGTEGLWIGLNDAQTEGTFVWASGEPVTYTNWFAGEPNNTGAGEDYVHLTLPGVGPQGTSSWNDFANLPWRAIIEVALPIAHFVPFGAGCPGPGGPVPLLAGVPGEVPRLGTTARIRVSHLPLAVTLPIFVLGLSNTQDPGPPAYSLPLDLGFLGWPGCSQLVSDDLTTFAITTTGTADYTLAVPMNLALVGFMFFSQAVVFYSPNGVAVSNGVAGIVGF